MPCPFSKALFFRLGGRHSPWRRRQCVSRGPVASHRRSLDARGGSPRRRRRRRVTRTMDWITRVAVTPPTRAAGSDTNVKPYSGASIPKFTKSSMTRSDGRHNTQRQRQRRHRTGEKRTMLRRHRRGPWDPVAGTCIDGRSGSETTARRHDATNASDEKNTCTISLHTVFPLLERCWSSRRMGVVCVRRRLYPMMNGIWPMSLTTAI